MERIKPLGKEYSQSMSNVGSFCSTSSTNEVTGFRAEVAGSMQKVKSTTPNLKSGEATIPRVISWMQLYYGTRLRMNTTSL